MTPRLQRLQEAGTAATTTEETPRTREAFSDPASMSGRVEAVNRAFSAAYPSDYDAGQHNYVEEVYEDRILARVGEDTLQIAYTVDSDNSISLGDSTRVTVGLQVTPLEEAAGVSRGTPERFQATTTGGGILESLDEGEGRIWRVTMVRPGISHNGRRYRADVLAEATQRYEGARSFDGHRNPEDRRRSAIGSMAGWHENVTAEADGSLTADFHISEAREDLRQHFLTAWRNNRPQLIGFSHDVSAITEAVMVGGRRISDVRQIVEVHSVDVVADPSAGGRMERLVASRQEEDTVNLQEFLRAFRAGELTADQLAEAYEEHPEWEEITEAITAEREVAQAASAATLEETENPPAASNGGVAEPQRLSGTLRDLVVTAAMEQANLPAAARERLNEALGDDPTEAEIVQRVQETQTIWDAALAASPAQLAGQAVRVGEGDADKLQHALDAMVFGESEREGVPAFRSIKSAYAAFTGRSPYSMGEEDFNRWILAESVGCLPYAGAERLTESLTTASWAEALGDSITRRLIAEYQSNEYATWRQIVSDITSPPDFRTNRRVRVGGYDVLPTVAESGVYTALTSPGDEEATFAVTKKGGTEDYTLETIANDDLGALRRIPRNLGRAAALTLYRAIWNTTIAGNALIYDGVALFAAGHNNDNATTPLDEAGVSLLRRRMIRQTQPGETSGFVGITPRFLVVPPELFVSAYKLANSEQAVVGSAESATTPNPFRGLTVIEVPTFTDINDWLLVASPESVPTLEVGFYQGRQDPELLIQDQPAVGSVFTNDVFTWKIRHIWGLTVLDFRGFQRATQV